MKYVSEEKMDYDSQYHGLFSKRLAEWAVGNMKIKDPATRQLKPIKARTIDEVKELLGVYKVDFPDEFLYTAYYLFNMAIADYEKSLKTDEQRIRFVEETICDPDCRPEAVLECFATKMWLVGKPIFWEMYL